MMSENDSVRGNEAAHAAWEENAAFWDRRMGEGNDFVDVLIWPPTKRFLDIHPGDRILDVACGNGLTSRRLAALGARVTAIDFSAEMIALAKKRSGANESIRYEVLDATNFDALVGLGAGSFDAVLCSMALFDMADIGPLFNAVPRLLRSGGRFVFSLMHPCFNNPFSVQTARLAQEGSTFDVIYSVEVSRYLSSGTKDGVAIAGQPVLHPYFHRSLTDILGTGFKAGLVLDAFEERAFPPEHPMGSTPLSWGGKYGEIPPAIVVRMRPLTA